MQQGHGIVQNWSKLTALFLNSGHAYFDPLEINIVKDILEDLVEIDATGQVFRYPEDSRGGKHLERISLINVEVLADGMRTVSWLLGALGQRFKSASRKSTDEHHIKRGDKPER